MGVSNHYRHVKVHEYETTHRDMLQASTDELIARGYAQILEEDELKVLAQYHYEKFRNFMAPLFRDKDQDIEDVVSSEITIQMPPIELPASKK